MLALFLAFFAASLLFLFFFLLKLSDDLKKQSLRPIFIMLLAIAFWGGVLGAFVAPEVPSSTVYPATNIIIGNSISNAIAQYPLENVTTTPAALPQRDYNAFFYIWLTVLLFMFFMILLWYLFLLRTKSAEIMHAGSDALGQMEKKKFR